MNKPFLSPKKVITPDSDIITLVEEDNNNENNPNDLEILTDNNNILRGDSVNYLFRSIFKKIPRNIYNISL